MCFLPGGETAEYYRNRKGFFSINVQTVVDSQLRILDIVARWPGSSHDQTVFNNSFIKQRLINKEFGETYILGDKGYDNTSYLLTPLNNPVTPSENLYNESQIRTRNVVERSYGVWKSRFPVLSKKITLDLSRVQGIIVACAVLHNIAIDMGDHPIDYYMASTIGDEEEDSENNSSRGTTQDRVRKRLINEYFSTLINSWQ